MRWPAYVVSALALAALAALAACAWVLGTESGLRWTLARAQSAVPALRIEEPAGTLAGTVRIERLAYVTDGLSVRASALAFSADLLAALAGRIALGPLQAQTLDIEVRDGPARSGAGASLPLPVALEDVSIERLAVTLAGRTERLRDLRLSHLRVSQRLSAAGSALRPDERFPARASFTIGGSLQRIDVSVQASVAGVPAKARALVRAEGEPRLEALQASAGPLDLSDIDPGMPRTALSAVLDAKATKGGLAGSLSAANAAHGPIDEQKIPIARLDARFSQTGEASVAFERLSLGLSGGGTLEGSGEATLEALRASLRASGVDLRAIRSTLRATRLEGPLEVRLSRDAQALSGRLSQDDVSVEADLERKGDVLDVRGLRAAAAGGTISGDGRVRLSELAFEAALSVASVDPSAFGDYPAGSLNGSVTASGRGREIDARWTLRESTLLGRALESAGRARFSPGRVRDAQAKFAFGRVRGSAQGEFGRPGDALAWQLEVPALEELDPRLAGELAASGSASGSIDDPTIEARARAKRLRLAGRIEASEAEARFSGRLGRHEIALRATAPERALEALLRGGWTVGSGWSGEIASLSTRGEHPLELAAPAKLEASPERVALGRLEARFDGGRISLAGARWQPGQLSSSGEVSGLPAQWVLRWTPLAPHAGGDLRVDGAWSLAMSPRLEGTVRLRRASGDLAIDGVPVGLDAVSLDARISDGSVTTSGRIATRFGSANLEGTIERAPGADAPGTASPVALRAQADLSALRALAQPFLDEAKLDGHLKADLAVTGTLGSPSVGGTLAGDDLSLELRPHGVYLKDGRLRAELQGDSLAIKSLSVRAGNGRFTASGTLPLRLALGTAKLDWRARNFALIERPDLRLVASGDGEVTFDGKRLSLVGDLRADRGRVELAHERLPQLGDDVVIVGRERPQRAGEVRLPLAVDVMLDLGEELTVEARGFDGRLEGRVQVVTNEAGQLRAYGELRAVNATFLAYGHRLEVDPGIVIFDGPIDNPSLQITAWRRNQAVEAGVQISGTALVPRVQLVSQPPVPEGERLSWLVLGRAPGEASQADLGLLQAAAGALLASGDAMPLDRRLARSVGLDEVSLRGTGEVQDRVVAFGKRLSDRVYVSYERGLGAVASNLVKLDYALSRRWSLRAETGSTTAGSTTSGWGVFYRFSWD